MNEPTINTPTGPAPMPPPIARCAWIVTAGLAPGEPDPAYTRSWSMDSTDWLSSANTALYNAHLVAAVEYARWLMEPQRLNWVRLEWVWY